jgi:glycosyltransferase involved in cell wall biosynthesis
MLVGPGAEFMGSKLLDIFRSWIYYFILITSYFERLMRRETDNKKNDKKEFKVLFVVRDWGVRTTLNIDIAESLPEYCGAGNVTILEVLKYDNIVYAIEESLKSDDFSHIILDTRVMLAINGFVNVVKSLYNCCSIARLSYEHNAVCLCGMTDLQPGYKLHAELLTSYGGLAIGWSDKSSGFFKFRHKRFVGPLFTPKSQKTIKKLMNSSLDGIPKSDVAIVGGDYEPRKSLVEKLDVWMKNNSILHYISTQKSLEPITYLNIFRNSKISFNTNWVVGRKDKYHFVGRNFEIALTGSLLLTQKCYGLDLYLEEGNDYIAFDDFDDLTKKIDYYLSHEKQRLKIAKSGQQKVLELFNTNFVWNEINKALRVHHLSEIKEAKSVS